MCMEATTSEEAVEIGFTAAAAPTVKAVERRWLQETNAQHINISAACFFKSSATTIRKKRMCVATFVA